MSSTESRQVKRPRVSLSCMVCRRRKVRCGREHPQCANCVRMKEKCVYNPTTRDGLIGQGHESETAAQEKSTEGLESHTKELIWAHWVPGGRGNRRDSGDEPQSPSLAGATVAGSPSRLTRAICKQGAMNHTIVLQSEDVMKLPVGQNTATDARSDTTSVILESLAPPPSASSPDASKEQQNSLWGRGHLSLGRGSRARYISPAFWGFVTGNESISDDFFAGDRNVDPELPPSHISSIGIAQVLRSLPDKAVSDALLEVFFLVVWPLAPLVYSSTIRADYDEFWDWCCNNKNNLPPQKFRDDPTFFCLLFAVLYSGASAAPAGSWTSGGLQGLQKETTVQSLKTAYEMSLSSCQHLEHPTLNTLISSLLTRSFVDWPRESMREVIAVSTTVRLAQSLGLHRDGTHWSALSPADMEIRRRAWWHIVKLDVQSSISSGLPLCCKGETQEAVGVIADTRDEDVDGPNRMSSKESIGLMFAIGCAETALLQAKIIAHLQSEGGLRRDEFGELVAAAKEHQQKIDSLISRIRSQGIPERGLIPSLLANASPSTHPELYKDDATRPTVLGAWVRVMLTLLKFDVAILLQKSFLPPPGNANSGSCKAWTSVLQVCVSYFRILLPICQGPAFYPYKWFHRSYVMPLQCLFLSLVYLTSFKDEYSTQTPVARYYVDEMIEHIAAVYQSTQPSSVDNGPNRGLRSEPSKAELPPAIQTLVNLHRRPDSKATPPPPLVSRASNQDLSRNTSMANDFSLLDADFLASITELSSSLILQ
ncbi:hypothetical protein BJX65DRAFT_285749 [Aspergillus insuetus]